MEIVFRYSRLALPLVFIGLLGIDATGALTQPAPMPANDRLRIAEGRRIAEALQDKLWEGWSAAPFSILLVTKEREFLVYHPNPSNDFVSVGYDSLLQSNVFTRERVFEPGLLATFPAVGGVATIVIGQPQNTEASHSSRWVITLLHEHFHQWQMSQPDYYARIDSLGLNSGDSSGMWMLDYPFPYEDKAVRAAFSALCQRLEEAVSGEGGSPNQLDAYLDTRASLQRVLQKDDYAYLSFQIWQEGIARYTEYMIASKAGVAYRPTDAFKALPDFVPFNDVAEDIQNNIMSKLAGMSLKRSRRTAFYAVGAAEGLLLDHVSPGWRADYMAARFDVEPLYPTSSE